MCINTFQVACLNFYENLPSIVPGCEIETNYHNEENDEPKEETDDSQCELALCSLIPVLNKALRLWDFFNIIESWPDR